MINLVETIKENAARHAAIATVAERLAQLEADQLAVAKAVADGKPEDAAVVVERIEAVAAAKGGESERQTRG